ncbi:MAG TPA: DNA N-6-adenine-methyltransferase [Anaerovoracaceae bacterium]|nr:DNA N-6-adenine-methyltransferase [Anaerovoracaceae bacterium]
MNTDVMFSSAYDAWATPQAFFDELDKKYDFDIDVCAEDHTAKCATYWTILDDCLSIDWKSYGDLHFDASPTCYMNPPYGREIGKFIKKAYEESIKGCEVICLLPARTDTKWFHEYCTKGEITFLKGRLIFGTDEYWQWVWNEEILNGKKNSLYKKFGKKNSAPFPSMVVVFNPRRKNML